MSHKFKHNLHDVSLSLIFGIDGEEMGQPENTNRRYNRQKKNVSGQTFRRHKEIFSSQV